MTKANIQGTVDIETVPSGLEVTFGDNQISVKYDGEVSTMELDDDGFFVESARNIAPAHSERILEVAAGAYEAHMDIQEQS